MELSEQVRALEIMREDGCSMDVAMDEARIEQRNAENAQREAASERRYASSYGLGL